MGPDRMGPRSSDLGRIGMEALALPGFVFGLMGSIFAISALRLIQKLKEELENLRKEVQALKDGGNEA